MAGGLKGASQNMAGAPPAPTTRAHSMRMREGLASTGSSDIAFQTEGVLKMDRMSRVPAPSCTGGGRARETGCGLQRSA